MKQMLDIAYGTESPAQRLDVYLPEGKADGVFVYFHGGGLERGDKERAMHWADHLAERGIATVSCNYRMYPEARYPDYIRDAARALLWVKDNMPSLCGSSTLYAGGSSAGGYLSMMLCFDKRWLFEVGMKATDLAGFLHDAGQPTAHFRVLRERGIDPKRVIVDDTAPLYYIGLEEDLPPMRFLVSDNDKENRLEQTHLVLSTLKHFGFTRFDSKLLSGKHCAYCRPDESGKAKLGEYIWDFIQFAREG